MGFLDSVEQEKGGAGGGSGAGRGWVLLEWSRKGGSREGGREWGRGGWVEWEGGQGRRFWWVNCPKQKRGSFWLVFLDRVEQEGTGAGGGSGAGGWLGGVGGGSQARTFWWDLVGMRVGSELPKTEKRKFLVGFLDRVE